MLLPSPSTRRNRTTMLVVSYCLFMIVMLVEVQAWTTTKRTSTTTTTRHQSRRRYLDVRHPYHPLRHIHLCRYHQHRSCALYVSSLLVLQQSKYNYDDTTDNNDNDLPVVAYEEENPLDWVLNNWFGVTTKPTTSMTTPKQLFTAPTTYVDDDSEDDDISNLIRMDDLRLNVTGVVPVQPISTTTKLRQLKHKRSVIEEQLFALQQQLDAFLNNSRSAVSLYNADMFKLEPDLIKAMNQWGNSIPTNPTMSHWNTAATKTIATTTYNTMTTTTNTAPANENEILPQAQPLSDAPDVLSSSSSEFKSSTSSSAAPATTPSPQSTTLITVEWPDAAPRLMRSNNTNTDINSNAKETSTYKVAKKVPAKSKKQQQQPPVSVKQQHTVSVKQQPPVSVTASDPVVPATANRALVAPATGASADVNQNPAVAVGRTHNTILQMAASNNNNNKQETMSHLTQELESAQHELELLHDELTHLQLEQQKKKKQTTFKQQFVPSSAASLLPLVVPFSTARSNKRIPSQKQATVTATINLQTTTTTPQTSVVGDENGDDTTMKPTIRTRWLFSVKVFLARCFQLSWRWTGFRSQLFPSSSKRATTTTRTSATNNNDESTATDDDNDDEAPFNTESLSSSPAAGASDWLSQVVHKQQQRIATSPSALSDDRVIVNMDYLRHIEEQWAQLKFTNVVVHQDPLALETVQENDSLDENTDPAGMSSQIQKRVTFDRTNRVGGSSYGNPKTRRRQQQEQRVVVPMRMMKNDDVGDENGLLGGKEEEDLLGDDDVEGSERLQQDEGGDASDAASSGHGKSSVVYRQWSKSSSSSSSRRGGGAQSMIVAERKRDRVKHWWSSFGGRFL